MKKNTLLKIFAALGIAALALFALDHYLKPNVEIGDKQVEIIVQVQQEDQSMETVFDEIVHTDAALLADLLLEMDQRGLLTIVLSGNQSDPYGRSLMGINGYEITDWNSGPWWLYNSENNPDCVKAGYCAGIDSCPIYDEDIFVFRFTSSY